MVNESHSQSSTSIFLWPICLDIVPYFSSTLHYWFYSADFSSSSGARHCRKRAAPNTSPAPKVPPVQTARRKVHSLRSCSRFLLCHEYFIQRLNRRRSCLPGWKMGDREAGVGAGGFSAAVWRETASAHVSSAQAGNRLTHMSSPRRSPERVPVARFFCSLVLKLFNFAGL